MSNQKNCFLKENPLKTTFMKAPSALFRDEKLRKLSPCAKLLYIALLGRLSLSERNNWRDESGRLYIYYTLKDVTMDIGCCMEKAVKIFSELDTKRGVGLIERKRRGFGQPSIIYFMDIKAVTSNDHNESPEKGHDLSTNNPQTYPQSQMNSAMHNDEPQQSYTPKNRNEISENPQKRLLKIRNSDFGKTEPNKNNINNINNINNKYIYLNNNHSINHTHGNEMNDCEEKRNFYQSLLKSNLNYDDFQSKIPLSRLDEFIAIMTDVLCSKDEHIKIGGQMLKASDVKERFLKLDFDHVHYVYDSLQKVKTPVSNPRAYIVSALYRSYDSAYLWGDIKSCDF